MLPLGPPSPNRPSPLPPSPALRPRKRFIVQAGSKPSEAWFWLVRCAASETLTFLQGLHLELVSCSGCAGQGRSLAQLCDWVRLSIYGPQDGCNCQTVICQSLTYRFEPGIIRQRAYDWCKGVSEVTSQAFTSNRAANLGISQSAAELFREQRSVMFCIFTQNQFFFGKYGVMIRNSQVI